MDWANETYVRLYVRDTTTWLRLGWDGQNVLSQMLRKVDMAGVMDIGEMEPWEAVVIHCRAPEDAAKAGMEVCLRLGVLAHNDTYLVAPNFRAAQEAVKSDKQRQKELRERRRVTAVTKRDGASRNVTPESRAVTGGHALSRPVTHCVALRYDTDAVAAGAADDVDIGTPVPGDSGKVRVTARDSHAAYTRHSCRTYPLATFAADFDSIAAQANDDDDPPAALEAATAHHLRPGGWALGEGNSVSRPKHLAQHFHRELAEARGAKPPRRPGAPVEVDPSKRADLRPFPLRGGQ